MNERTDAQRIADMIGYAQETIVALGDTGFEGFRADLKLQLVIFYLVAVVGEAAGKCAPETLRQYPGIPWHQVRGTRNHLAHDYYKADLWMVYRIVVDYLPPFISELTSSTANSQGGQPL